MGYDQFCLPPRQREARWRAVTSTPQLEALEAENRQLRQELRVMELKLKAMQLEQWARKSERFAPAEDGQGRLFAEQPSEAAAPVPRPPSGRATRVTTQPKGPQPLDPNLRRETVQVPAPELSELICPVTQKPRQPGFTEALEVLARKPAEYYVKRYERIVFVSPAKTAPVYAPWPADVLPRSRMHASVVAHVAAVHFCEHVPYHRLEQQLARTGVDLPRVTQVSLMRQLNELLAPMVSAMKQEVLQSDYLMVDATPVPLCDPARPGAAREATLWAYRNASGTVWFDYQTSKSPQHPDRVLLGANFRGLLQTDAASGLGSIGPPGQVISLGCFAHARRYAFKAWKAGELDALPYLTGFNRLFRIDRLAHHFRLTKEHKTQLRQRHSIPLFDTLVTRAAEESIRAAPKSLLGKALHYLLAQTEPLRRTLLEARAELSTNWVENAIRPLKLGVRNWLQIGHPEAGPRLANLFTVVENCRQLDVDPEAYLIELIARLPDHPAARVTELMPRAWQQARTPAAATTAVASPA